MNRSNPFDDLEDFVPDAKPKPVIGAAIEQIARENGFMSRQPSTAAATPTGQQKRPVRRWTTGRNQQLNLKATPQAIDRFYRLADARNITLGELLEHALDALEAANQEQHR